MQDGAAAPKQAPVWQVENWPIENVKPYSANPRVCPPEAIKKVAESIRKFGWRGAILVDAAGEIIAGHTRLKAGQALGYTTVPVVVARDLTPEQVRAFRIADNRVAEETSWDEQLLATEVAALAGLNFDISSMGFDPKELDQILGVGGGNFGGSKGSGALAQQFGVPPVSILSARDGWWQARKAAWLALGIKSEVGREGDLTFRFRDSDDDFIGAVFEGMGATSVFDPTLCELAYRWFSPPGGAILDPFAGGSVRGVVAAKLGRVYTGVDLRADQIAANREQAQAIIKEGPTPTWIEGDSAAVVPGLGIQADFVFSCPPYGDLEVYSDNPADLSQMDHAGFVAAYRAIIAASVAKLKPDRFACFVVGDFRDGKGLYRNFVSETIGAFEAAGARLYNEAILVTMMGTVPLRAGRSFRSMRKLGKTHQNVLVFVKGDPAAATAAIGECEFGEIEPEQPIAA